MKTNKIYKYIAGIIGILLISIACTENEYGLWDEASSGYIVNINSSGAYVSGTFDLSTNTIDYDSVYLYLEYEFPTIPDGFEYIKIQKEIYSESDELLISGEVSQVSALPDTVLIEYGSVEELFGDIDFSPDSMKTGYYMQMTTMMYRTNGDSIVSLTGNYTFTPSLSGFCEVPTLPAGTWVAKNNTSSFTKEIVIESPSPHTADDEGRYWLSDFGLDWSTWSDVWYTLEFKLECPRGDNDSQYHIVLMPNGIYDAGVTQTGKDRDGTTAEKTIRVMPYEYGADTEAYGYYDDEKKQIIFENVSVVDSWWNTDNHTVDLTFTYKAP